MAVITGSIFSAILQIPGLESASEESRYIIDIMAALSVGLGIMVMVSTNTEHPPAADTALGLLVHGWAWSAVEFILSDDKPFPRRWPWEEQFSRALARLRAIPLPA